MNKGLNPIYEQALEELAELIRHNTDLNFGFELPVDVESFISMPDPTNLGSTLSSKTKKDIMLEIYERQFDDSRNGNAITPLHKDVIKLQQDIAIYLLEIEKFVSDLKLFPFKQYLPDTIIKVLQNTYRNELHELCTNSFMSFLMSKIIGTTEIEMLRKLGNNKIIKKFCRPDHDQSLDRLQLAIEKQKLQDLLNRDEKDTDYYKLAQYFTDL